VQVANALTRRDAELHQRARELVTTERELTLDERWFVLAHWQEVGSATAVLDGAFFTPLGLAGCLAMNVAGTRIVDLCAGIGRLAWACYEPYARRDADEAPEIVCIERNPAYVAVGQRVLPEARWICADVFDVGSLGLGEFDTAVANPPFGPTHRSRRAPRYRGSRAEFEVIDLASTLAAQGVFVIPTDVAPYRGAGLPGREPQRLEAYIEFTQATGLVLQEGLSIDTAVYRRDWNAAVPLVEVVTCNFSDAVDGDRANRRAGNHESSSLRRRPAGSRTRAPDRLRPGAQPQASRV
jgi:hypothetical protein